MSTRRATYCIVSPDRGFARMLDLALRFDALRARRLSLSHAARDKAEIAIYAFDPAAIDAASFADDQIAFIERDPAPMKIMLQLAAPPDEDRAAIDRKNRVIETLARRAGARIVTTASILQSGAKPLLAKSGRPTLKGYATLAHAILRLVNAQGIRTQVGNAEAPAATTGALPGVDEVLAAMMWNAPSLPANLALNYGREAIADFADGIVMFPTFRFWGKFPLGDSVDWAMAGANWTWQSFFTGLEFLRPPLALWFDAANRRDGKPDVETLAALAQRGKTPDDLLRRAGFLIADFARANPPAQPKNQRAYFQGTILRRVKVLLTFLTCAKKAAEMGVALDREEIAVAFKALADSFEILKRDEIYPKAGNHGVRQDVLFIVAGLLWHKLPYGRGLLDLGMRRLEHEQLARGLSPDGVWLENSYGYHCLIMNQLTMAAADMRTAGAPGVEVLHDALRRMQPFAEALIKCDGRGPLIGDTRPTDKYDAIAEAASELSPGTVPVPLTIFRRAKETYFFPDAGYFASHTSRDMDPQSSTVILFANLSEPKHKQSDDLSVLFTHGATDLLIDGGTYNKEISDTVRNAARFDPGSHNTFRINAVGYPVRAGKGAKPAGLSGMWEGDGWAAARGFNNAYPDGRVVRFAIHLKRHHAVIVLDRLSAKASAPALFEQFWHIAPEFVPAAPPANLAGPWLFASSDKGVLIAAFDGEESKCVVEFGGPENPIAWLMQTNETVVPTPYIRRTRSLREGTMASLFQWSERAGVAEIAFTPRGKAETEITARGIGFACRFVAGETKVECLALGQS